MDDTYNKLKQAGHDALAINTMIVMAIKEKIEEGISYDPFDLNPHLYLRTIVDDVIQKVIEKTDGARCTKKQVYEIWLTNIVFNNLLNPKINENE